VQNVAMAAMANVKIRLGISNRTPALGPQQWP
jgi:hypothetical protein